MSSLNFRRSSADKIREMFRKNQNLRNSISARLLFKIFLASSVITFVMTLTQLAFDFHQETSIVRKSVDLVEAGHSKSIANFHWDDGS